MTTVILVIHLLLAIAMVGAILLQKSEGGGLGIGGSGSGGGMGGFLTGRSAANLLTRTTAILATCFFATSLTLAILAGNKKPAESILDQPAPAIQKPVAPKDQKPSAPLAK
ncbi:MAG: preprotein translocase subunit SecG [Rhodospirillales bacterium]|jgi:preprotein translocase subunit SecG